MAGHSFIDIAVLEPIRSRFAAGDALLLVDTGLDTVIWANGAGAEMIGHGQVEAAIGAETGFSPAARRQIMATPGFPAIGENRTVIVRIGREASRAVLFRASAATLPSGEAAILLAAPIADAARAPEQIVRGLSGAGEEGAWLDEEGGVLAATDGFAAMAPPREAVADLVRAVARERDRLVKRILTVPSGRIGVGVARLADAPARYLMVLVAEGGEAAAPQPAPAAPAQGRPPTAPDDTWYFHREEAHAPSAASAPAEPVAAPVRFAWRTDAEGRFSAVSPEFAQAVGKPAADVIGRSFAEVARVFNLDPDGEVAGLLARRDTWSGRTVFWPIAGLDLKAPVDLAALPAYTRDRQFDGFRGFGIVRRADAVGDAEAIGLSLTAPDAPRHHAANRDPFDGEPPALATHAPSPASDKVVRLAERRAAPSDKELSQTERLAFREIGDRLKSAAPGVDAQTGERAAETGDASWPAAEFDADGLTDDDGAPSTGETPFDQAEIGEIDETPAETFFQTADADIDDVELLPSALGGDAPTPEAAAPAEIAAAHAPEQDDEAAAASGDDGPQDAEGEPPREKPANNAGFPEAPDVFDEPDEAIAVGEGQPAFQIADQPDLTDAAAPEAPQPREITAAAPLAAGPALLARLPLPMLVHSGDRLHFANDEFLERTGYASLDELNAAGGLGALIAGPYPDDDEAPARRRAVRLIGKDGGEFAVEAHLQSIPWIDGRALLLSLRPVLAPAPALREETSDAPAEMQDAVDEPAAPTSASATVVAFPTPEERAPLAARVAELETILDTATDGIVTLDPDGTIRSTSRAAQALFGFDAADLAGKPFTSLFASESQRSARDYLASLSENGVASVLNDGREVIGREAKGGFIPLFMTIGRLPGDSGYCAVLRDITQFKRAEEELTQARRKAEAASSQKSDFLARVSHEVRTPLNAIIGFSELMLDEKFGAIGNERYRDYLRDINKSGNHVLDLVNDLLDISKIEAGQQDLSYEAVRLNETLGEAVSLMQPQANRDRVIIRSSFASNLPEVVADLRSVKQIALNLLSNAVRFTNPGGQVILSTAYEANGDVVMRVRDTGIGMSRSEIEQALKPFKQVSTLKRPRGDGTGLGLPLTKALVEANRARFAIASTPGEGTMVEVVFPSTRVLAG